MTKRSQLIEFMKRMDEGGIAIIPAAHEVLRSNDTHHRYRQNSDFHYLTGFSEPEAIAVIKPSHPEHKYILFVRPRDAEKETWDGKRAGVEGATSEYGADAAFPLSEFDTKLSELLGSVSNLYYRLGVDSALDQRIVNQLVRLRAMNRPSVNPTGVQPPAALIDTGTIIHEMRLLKTDDEIAVMQQAANITAEAHCEAMKFVRPGVNEYEVEALIDYVFRRNGATSPAYPTIIGGGANATVLHYTSNVAVLADGDLLLVDAGAEYDLYTADITRTFPVNGRFTEAQQDIYGLVLEAQTACIEMMKPGVRIEELYNRSVEILVEGMLRFELLAGEAGKLIEEKKHKQFYPHGLGHYLGMDVHDVGRYHVAGKSRELESGMVITVEPGLYIPLNAPDVPDKYRGIGVRIEDDVLVTATGNRVLTSNVPKEPGAIEELIGSKR